jgi:FixJ family two-component response regulator
MRKSSAVIHVVDDGSSFRSAIGELLSACGYEVSLHKTATEFLACPLSSGPACLLLDLQMDGLNGLQLQDRLSERGCSLPIVFISAHGDIPTTVQTIKAGAEDFLTKPVIRDKLLKTIERALARYEATQAQEVRIATIRSLFANLRRAKGRSSIFWCGVSRTSRSPTTWAYRSEPSGCIGTNWSRSSRRARLLSLR